MPARWPRLLSDARLHLIALAGAVAIMAQMAASRPPGRPAAAHIELGSPPVRLDADHDPATCQWCLRLGPEEHAGVPRMPIRPPDRP